MDLRAALELLGGSSTPLPAESRIGARVGAPPVEDHFGTPAEEAAATVEAAPEDGASGAMSLSAALAISSSPAPTPPRDPQPRQVADGRGRTSASRAVLAGLFDLTRTGTAAAGVR